MRTDHRSLLTAIAAFAGGFAAGVFFAPQSGRELRKTIGQGIQAQTERIHVQLQGIENQLHHIERQIEATGSQIAEAGKKVIDKYGPGVVPGSEEWEIDSDEIEKDLPRMPHR